MTSSESASLTIAFDPTRTRAVLRAAQPYQQAFARLVAQISPGSQRELLSAEVDLDDLLTGLGALGTWPDPVVVWEDDLSQLVTEVLDDAEAAEGQLTGDAGRPELDALDVHQGLGSGWMGDLTSFQRRDVARLLSLRHGANFSVPGAGKTRVALAVFAALRERGMVDRLLVVCPKSAAEAWQLESSICFAEPPVIRTVSRNFPSGAEVLLVNYERLDRSLAALAGWLSARPALLVLDEAHRMKLGARGVYGSACMALGPLSRRRLVLTGTPAPNGARDLENILSFVWPGHGRRVVTDAVAGGDLAHASRVLRPLFTRTTKAELGLPSFTPKLRYLELPPLHREIYDALVGSYSARAEATREDFDALGRALLRLIMAATSPALLTEGTTRYEPLSYRVPPLAPGQDDPLLELLRNLPSYELSPKYAETVRIVARNAGQGRKTLVWSNFVRNLTTLEHLLEPYGPAVVYGGTRDRQGELSRFRGSPDCLVLLANPATLGEGISLHQVCHDAVYIDRDFLAGRFLQSLDRIHRLGLSQDTVTNVTILASRGTVDELVALRLDQKLEFMGRILDDPEVQQLGDLEEEAAHAGGMDAIDMRLLLRHLNGKA